MSCRLKHFLLIAFFSCCIFSAGCSCEKEPQTEEPNEFITEEISWKFAPGWKILQKMSAKCSHPAFAFEAVQGDKRIDLTGKQEGLENIIDIPSFKKFVKTPEDASLYYKGYSKFLNGISDEVIESVDKYHEKHGLTDEKYEKLKKIVSPPEWKNNKTAFTGQFFLIKARSLDEDVYEYKVQIDKATGKVKIESKQVDFGNLKK